MVSGSLVAVCMGPVVYEPVSSVVLPRPVALISVAPSSSVVGTASLAAVAGRASSAEASGMLAMQMANANRLGEKLQRLFVI